MPPDAADAVAPPPAAPAADQDAGGEAEEAAGGVRRPRRTLRKPRKYAHLNEEHADVRAPSEPAAGRARPAGIRPKRYAQVAEEPQNAAPRAWRARACVICLSGFLLGVGTCCVLVFAWLPQEVVVPAPLQQAADGWLARGSSPSALLPSPPPSAPRVPPPSSSAPRAPVQSLASPASPARLFAPPAPSNATTTPPLTSSHPPLRSPPRAPSPSPPPSLPPSLPLRPKPPPPCSPVLPPPPSPPLPSPAPTPPPPIHSPPSPPPIVWELHSNLNCWWDGNGADELWHAKRGESISGVHSVEGCKTACLAHRRCEGFYMNSQGLRNCYLKTNIKLQACHASFEGDMFVRAAPSPPPPRPSPPSPRRPPFTPSRSVAVSWDVHPDLNCWWDGNGAQELSDPDHTIMNFRSVEECKAKCLAKPECEGLLVSKPAKNCFLKTSIEIDKCHQDPGGDMLVWRRDETYPSTRGMLTADSSITLSELHDIFRAARTVAVVGSSGNLLYRNHGQEINRHGLLMRFNGAVTKGYENDVGRDADSGRAHGVIRTAWETGYTEAVAKGLLSPSTIIFQGLTNIYTDPTFHTDGHRTAGIRALWARYLHEQANFLNLAGDAPSTGFIGVAAAVAISYAVGVRVAVYGYGPCPACGKYYDCDGSNSSHTANRNAEAVGITSYHPFDVELGVLERWHNEGVIYLIKEDCPSSFASHQG